MNLEPYIDRLRKVCDENSVQMLGVFGSVARDEDSIDSDIDLLIKLGKPIGFVEFIDLEDAFQEVLGRPVDLATEASLHPLIKTNVLHDLKVIYEK